MSGLAGVGSSGANTLPDGVSIVLCNIDELGPKNCLARTSLNGIVDSACVFFFCRFT
jgi:hypothetical protein